MQSVATSYPEKPGRNLAPRVFAVLALIIVGVVIAALIAGSLGSSSSSPTVQSTATHASSAPKNPYYVVQAGDSFTQIAKTEGVSPERLRELNPNLDPLQLQPQNCVDLVPNGCKQLANGG